MLARPKAAAQLAIFACVLVLASPPAQGNPCEPPPQVSLILTGPPPEEHQPGTTVPITWASTGPLASTVELYYSVNGGANWNSVISAYPWVTPNDGAYDYTIPACWWNGQLLFRIGAAYLGGDGTTVCGTLTDYSDQPITTPLAPEVSAVLASPDGGELLRSGVVAPITWSTSGPVNNSVAVSYSVTGGSTWASIISNTPNDGVHYWTRPIRVGDHARVDSNQRHQHLRGGGVRRERLQLLHRSILRRQHRLY